MKHNFGILNTLWKLIEVIIRSSGLCLKKFSATRIREYVLRDRHTQTWWLGVLCLGLKSGLKFLSLQSCLISQHGAELVPQAAFGSLQPLSIFLALKSQEGKYRT